MGLPKTVPEGRSDPPSCIPAAARKSPVHPDEVQVSPESKSSTGVVSAELQHGSGQDFTAVVATTGPPAATGRDASPASQILSCIKSDMASLAQPSVATTGQQITRALHIRLHPEGLGDVRVTLKITGQALSVELRPTTGEAAAGLRHDLQRLEDSLKLIPGMTTAVVAILPASATDELAFQLSGSGSGQAGASLAREGDRQRDQTGDPRDEDREGREQGSVAAVMRAVSSDGSLLV